MAEEIRGRVDAMVLDDLEDGRQRDSEKGKGDESAGEEFYFSPDMQDSDEDDLKPGLAQHEADNESPPLNMSVTAPAYYPNNDIFIPAPGPYDTSIPLNPTTKYPPCAICASRKNNTNNKPASLPPLEFLPPIARDYQRKFIQHEQEQERKRMMGIQEDPQMMTLYEFHDAMKRLEQVALERVEKARRERVYEVIRDDEDDNLDQFDEEFDEEFNEEGDVGGSVVRSRL